MSERHPTFAQRYGGNRAVVDDARAITIDGLTFAVVLHADDEERLWSLVDDAPDDAPVGCACASCAPHEQLTPWSIDMEEIR